MTDLYTTTTFTIKRTYVHWLMDVRALGDERTCVGRWTYVRWLMDVRALGDGRTCVGRWTYVRWDMYVYKNREDYPCLSDCLPCYIQIYIDNINRRLSLLFYFLFRLWLCSASAWLLHRFTTFLFQLSDGCFKFL